MRYLWTLSNLGNIAFPFKRDSTTLIILSNLSAKGHKGEFRTHDRLFALLLGAVRLAANKRLKSSIIDGAHAMLCLSRLCKLCFSLTLLNRVSDQWDYTLDDLSRSAPAVGCSIRTLSEFCFDIGDGERHFFTNQLDRLSHPLRSGCSTSLT